MQAPNRAAAEAAYNAALLEGLDEDEIAYATEVLEAAEDAVAAASDASDAAISEANSIKEVKDSATVSMATLDQTVNPELYTADSYQAYQDAVDAFKEVVLSGSATKQDVIDARSDITKAYVGLELKSTNTLKAKGKTATVKYSVVKNKKTAIAREKAITVSKAVGTVTYKKASGNKKITIAKKTGKVTVKKGLKKGTYTVKVKVTAAGDDNYSKLTKTVKVKIKVK